MFAAKVVTRGPLFTGAAPGIMRQMTEAMTLTVAEEGADEVRAQTSQFRAPTGYWESQIGVNDFPNGHIVEVGLVYDRWLEGVSARNQSTRFKGYGLFKAAMSWLGRHGSQIAEEAAAPYIRRLN